MINELSVLVDTFAGTANHTRCFLHAVNLVAKSLIQQFAVKKGVAEDDELKELQRELAEEAKMEHDDDETGDEADNDEGLVDEMDEMTEEERLQQERLTQPVKLVLVKVRQNEVNVPHELIMCSAAKTGIQNHPLNNHCASHLEGNLARAQDGCPSHA